MFNLVRKCPTVFQRELQLLSLFKNASPPLAPSRHARFHRKRKPQDLRARCQPVHTLPHPSHTRLAQGTGSFTASQKPFPLPRPESHFLPHLHSECLLLLLEVLADDFTPAPTPVS